MSLAFAPRLAPQTSGFRAAAELGIALLSAILSAFGAPARAQNDDFAPTAPLAGTSISNRAVPGAGDSIDLISASVLDTLTNEAGASVTLSKSASVVQAQPGGEITFTINARHNGTLSSRPPKARFCPPIKSTCASKESAAPTSFCASTAPLFQPHASAHDFLMPRAVFRL